MGDYFTFEEKSALLRPVLRKESRFNLSDVVRYNFIFDSSEDLKLFLDMHPLEIILVGGGQDEVAEEMTHSEFMETYFRRANRIYVDCETEFMDMVSSADISGLIKKLSKQSPRSL